MPNSAPLVLFDGACNFCNASVNFVLDRDVRGILRFASLQSSAGRLVILRHGGTVSTTDPDSDLPGENWTTRC